MPVIWFQEKAFIGAIQQVFRLRFPVIVPDLTRALDANGRLAGIMMAVAPAYRFIYPIDIKDTFNVERYCFFDNGKVSPFISKCFQIDKRSHSSLKFTVQSLKL